MVDLNHLHPDIRERALATQTDRISNLTEFIWVGYELAFKAIDQMKLMMDIANADETKNALFSAAPNWGKTALLERFKKLHGDGSIDDEDRPHRPVISIEAPEIPEIKSLYMAILDEFHAPYRANDHRSVLKKDVLRLMRTCNVRLLLIDELHSILSGSTVNQRQVMNGIKTLTNQLNIPIVAFGTKVAVSVLHMDDQHAKRFRVYKIDQWEKPSEFQQFLVEFESVLPLRKPSYLSSKEMAAKIFASTHKGVIGEVKHLLTGCAKIAILDGTEVITIDTINQFLSKIVKTERGITYWKL